MTGECESLVETRTLDSSPSMLATHSTNLIPTFKCRILNASDGCSMASFMLVPISTQNMSVDSKSTI